MILHTHPHVIHVKQGQVFKIIAFGDVHWGARDCAEERFEREILEQYADDENAYFLMMGDMIDAIVTSDQKRYRPTVVKNPYATREDILDVSIDEFATLWERYKIPQHRVIGSLSGNHHDVILRRHGTDITERLAHRMKTKNLGYSAYIKLLTAIGKSNHRVPMTIFAHHGFGGSSRTDGGSITKYVRHAFRFQGADVYLYGHDHQKYAKRVAIVKPDWIGGHATDTSFVVAATGSFKRTVSHDGIPSYSEVAGYNPAELGGICINACVRERKVNGKDRMRLEVNATE